MTVEHLIEIALGNTAPQVTFILGLLFVIYKLGSLWIRNYFERIAPVQERQVSAIEKMADTADEFIKTNLREHRINSAAIEGLWSEIQASRKYSHISEGA